MKGYYVQFAFMTACGSLSNVDISAHKEAAILVPLCDELLQKVDGQGRTSAFARDCNRGRIRALLEPSRRTASMLVVLVFDESILDSFDDIGICHLLLEIGSLADVKLVLDTCRFESRR